MGEDEGRNKVNAPTLFVWALILLPLAYFLSTGPIAKLEQLGWLKSDSVECLYAPLGWVCQFAPFDRLLIYYLAYVWRIPIDL